MSLKYNEVTVQDYIVGYGSLLSHDSRYRFSNLNIQPVYVTLEGWQRAWSVRCLVEKQTYVGVTPNENALVNAAIIPTETITPELIEREKNYTFIKIDKSQLQVEKNKHVDPNGHFWLCQPNEEQSAHRDYPVHQTYVDTCILGCLESGDDSFAIDFVKHTMGWEHCWINDRHSPKYPRAAAASSAEQVKVDQILADAGVLDLRE